MRKLFLVLLLTGAAAAFAKKDDCKAPPTIDGAVSANEWTDAVQYRFDANLPYGGTTPATLYLTNDETDLYVALTFARAKTDETRSISIELHGPRGRADGPDDAVVVNFAPDGKVTAYDDYYYTGGVCPPNAICSGLDTAAGGTNEVAASGTFAGGIVTIEFRHPFTGADGSRDVQVLPGEKLSFMFNVRLLGPGAVWPAGFGDTRWAPTPNEYVVRPCKHDKKPK